MWHKQIQTLLLIVYVAFQVHALGKFIDKLVILIAQ